MLTGKIAQRLIARLNELVSAAQLTEPSLLGVSMSWKPALKPRGRRKSPSLQRRAIQSSFTDFNPSLKKKQTPIFKEGLSNISPGLPIRGPTSHFPGLTSLMCNSVPTRSPFGDSWPAVSAVTATVPCRRAPLSSPPG